jgi:hypothetical protein
MCFLKFHLAMPFEHQIKLFSVLAMYAIVRGIVHSCTKVDTETVFIADFPVYTSEDVVVVQIICLPGDVAFLLGLQYALRHQYHRSTWQ